MSKPRWVQMVALALGMVFALLTLPLPSWVWPLVPSVGLAFGVALGLAEGEVRSTRDLLLLLLVASVEGAWRGEWGVPLVEGCLGYSLAAAGRSVVPGRDMLPRLVLVFAVCWVSDLLSGWLAWSFAPAWRPVLLRTGRAMFATGLAWTLLSLRTPRELIQGVHLR